MGKSRKEPHTKTPLLSIITVTKNSSRTLSETFDSIRNQTFTNFEYIVIDGDSNDGTLEIINNNMDIIDKFISEKDAGLYFAMNKGLNLAVGEYVGIINSDDYYTDEAFSRVSEIISSISRPSIIYSAVEVIGNRKISNIHHSELRRRMIAHPTCFVPRGFYTSFGNFNVKFRIAADYELILRFMKIGLPFYKSDTILANYREGGFSSEHRRISVLETLQIQHPGGVRQKFIVNFKFASTMLKTFLKESLQSFKKILRSKN